MGLSVRILMQSSIEGDYLLVDTLAVDQSAKGQQVGTYLMRWAETCGRCADCQRVDLWAREPAVGFYDTLRYEKVEGRGMALDREKHFLMRRELLYNLPADGLAC